jgi:diguanylate cyclase (GGDEF)-like protein
MRVLVAEDDPVSRQLLQSSLEKWGYQVTPVADGDQAAAALAGEDPPTLAILDWEMPGKNGPEVCREIRALGREPYIYLILLTARSDKGDLIAGMDAGADDYLIKPLDRAQLQVRLRAARRIVDLQAQLVAAREELRLRAATDALTGLWNHGAMHDLLHRELARAERTGQPLGVVMADLDRFKSINDTLGHPAGDAVLREAAARLKSIKRAYDLVGRYGGEEFLVLLPGCGAADAAGWAERARKVIADTPFAGPAGPLTVTVSLGAGAVESGRKVAADVIKKAADAALYRAKRGGRNRVEPVTEADWG